MRSRRFARSSGAESDDRAQCGACSDNGSHLEHDGTHSSLLARCNCNACGLSSSDATNFRSLGCSRAYRTLRGLHFRRHWLLLCCLI